MTALAIIGLILVAPAVLSLALAALVALMGAAAKMQGHGP